MHSLKESLKGHRSQEKTNSVCVEKKPVPTPASKTSQTSWGFPSGSCFLLNAGEMQVQPESCPKQSEAEDDAVEELRVEFIFGISHGYGWGTCWEGRVQSHLSPLCLGCTVVFVKVPPFCCLFSVLFCASIPEMHSNIPIPGVLELSFKDSWYSKVTVSAAPSACLHSKSSREYLAIRNIGISSSSSSSTTAAYFWRAVPGLAYDFQYLPILLFYMQCT